MYYNIPTNAATRVLKSTVTSYPTDNTTSANDYIQKLSGSGTKIGSSITLKVTTGSFEGDMYLQNSQLQTEADF